MYLFFGQIFQLWPWKKLLLFILKIAKHTCFSQYRLVHMFILYIWWRQVDSLARMFSKSSGGRTFECNQKLSSLHKLLDGKFFFCLTHATHVSYSSHVSLPIKAHNVSHLWLLFISIFFKEKLKEINFKNYHTDADGRPMGDQQVAYFFQFHKFFLIK